MRRLVGLLSLTLVAWTAGAGMLGASVAADPEALLSQRQSILEAHRTLVAAGWSPAPAQETSPRGRLWSAAESVGLFRDGGGFLPF